MNLMERIEVLKKAIELSGSGVAFILITVTETKGSCPSVTGGRMIYTSDGMIYGTIGGGTLEKLAMKEAEGLLEQEGSLVKNYVLDAVENDSPDGEQTGMLCGGEVTLFFEHIGAAERAVIFGAGHIGKILYKLLSEIGFSVLVLDDREKQENIPGGMKITYYNEIEDGLRKVGKIEKSHVVIASHSHELDYKILRSILRSGAVPEYTGLVASKKKIEKMASNLKDEKISIPDDFLLYSPAGLDIGGRSPSEIALSIAAEIQSVRYNKRDFKHLSKFPGTIK